MVWRQRSEAPRSAANGATSHTDRGRRAASLGHSAGLHKEPLSRMGVASIVKELGWRDAALYLAGRVLEAASARRLRIVKYYLVAQPIGRPDAKPMRADSATEIATVAADDPLALAFPRPAEIIARRYANGACCTAARLRGEFAGFIWTQRGRYEEDELRCSYVLERPELSVWDFDVYVEPRFRIGRTMARLWSHVDAELAATGVRWSFSRISAFNPGSRSSHARLGAVDCGSALFLLAGPLQLALLPAWPYVHLSANPARAPVLRLSPPALTH